MPSPRADDPRATRPSIPIVVAFFGRAPLWLPAFLLSCRENRDVRWFLYTDFEVAGAFPPNVTLRRTDLQELSQRTSDVLGTKVEIQQAWKVNDLKPAYGLIFADDLQPFDFWAQADLDIVWGDIRHFITDSILSENDIVSSRSGRASGHFNLYRNTPEINRTFELIPNVAQAIANPQYLHLDERELTRHLKQRLRRTPRDSAPRVHWPQELTLDAAYQRALGNDQGLWWRNGKTFGAEGQEVMYVHFNKLKKDMTVINFEYDDAPAAFMIDRRGFSA